MPKGSHMDARRICDLAVAHLFKYLFNLGPRRYMLKAPLYLNPPLKPQQV